MKAAIMILLSAAASALAIAAEADNALNELADVIRAEAVRSNNDPGGRPLPLVAHWNRGSNPTGFSPVYQMQLLRAGSHVMPWFEFPRPGATPENDRYFSGEYLDVYKRVAALRLPFTLVGTQWEMILRHIYRARPEFWWEFSVWDGNQPGKDNDKWAFYEKHGESYTPVRHGSYVEYGLWRPRLVRPWRSYLDTRERVGDYFEAVVKVVDRVWADPVLTRFWRRGELVPNPAGKHPYNTAFPEQWKDEERWYLLETNLDPERPWENGIPQRVVWKKGSLACQETAGGTLPGIGLETISHRLAFHVAEGRVLLAAVRSLVCSALLQNACGDRRMEVETYTVVVLSSHPIAFLPVRSLILP